MPERGASPIDVLAMAGADLAGEIAGDPPVEPLFLGGEQIGWGVRRAVWTPGKDALDA
jgi:hypothetical protein